MAEEYIPDWAKPAKKVKSVPVEVKAQAVPDWAKPVDQNPGNTVGGSLQDSELERAMSERFGESPIDLIKTSIEQGVARGGFGLSDENYRSIGGDNEAVPKLLRPLTNVLPDALDFGVKALVDTPRIGIETLANVIDTASVESGLADAAASKGGLFLPGRIGLDILTALPMLGMEAGHLPGGRFMSPKRDILPPEVRQVLNEQVNAMWEAGASAQDINRFNVKNKLRPYTKDEMAELEKLAAERDAAKAEAEATVTAPLVKPLEVNTTAGEIPVSVNDNTPVDFTPSPRPEFGNDANLGKQPFESAGMMDFRHRTETMEARERGASREELDALWARQSKESTAPTGPVASKAEQDAALEEWLKADDKGQPEYTLADDASEAEVALWFKGQDAYFADKYRKEAAYHRSRGDERQAVATEAKISNRTPEEQERINNAYYASSNDNHWEAKTVNWEDGPEAIEDVLKDNLPPDVVPPKIETPTEVATEPEPTPVAEGRKLIVIHGGSDFDIPDAAKLGTGEPGNIRPLGKGLYGYYVNSQEEAAAAIEGARHYANKYGKGNKAIHIFEVDAKPGDLGSNGQMLPGFEDFFSAEQKAVNDAYQLASDLPPGSPERVAAYDKARELAEKAAKPTMRSETLPGGLHELAVTDLSKLGRKGKYPVATSTEDILNDLYPKEQPPVSDVATGVPAPEGVQSVSRATPETPPTASQKLFGLLGGVKEKLTQQAADRSTELSKRVKAAAAEGANKSGREGFEAEKQHLKGALPTETGKNIRDKFTEEDITALYDEIKSYPGFRYLDTVNARTGLTRFLDGDMPRPSELLLMEKVFGPEVVKEMMRNRKEIAEGVRGKGRGEQGELFSGSETTSTGPLTPPLKPEPKPVDPNKFIDDPKQGDLFRDKPKSRPPTPADKEGQIEMFSGAETTSTGPVRTLLPEEKPKDPDKFVDDPYQGDFFKDKPKFQKLFEDAKKVQKERPDPGLLAKLLGTVRQMKATIDLSMPGNQGWGMLAHPEFYRALKPMVVEAYYGLSKNPAHYLIRENKMRADPMFKTLEDMGVTFTDASGQRMLGEESFSTGYAQNIPVFGNLVEASNFGASTFLNELRFNVGKKFYNDAKKAGVDVEDKLFRESLANVINALSGRGSLGKFESAAGPAATALFSPRFMASRLQMMNPGFYRRLHPAVRKEMMKSMAGATAISTGVLAAMVAMGFPVVTDPKSTDFAKIKIGNTRYDVFGGLTSYIVMANRIIANQTTNSAGVTKELGKGYGARTAKDVFLDFFTNKAAPVPNYALRYLDGKNIDGTEFEPLKEAGKLLVPMYVEANYDAMVEYGIPEGFLRALPGFFGINASTYPDKREVKPVVSKDLDPNYKPEWVK